MAHSGKFKSIDNKIDFVEENFSIQDGEIYFGFTSVKNVGINEFLKIRELMKNNNSDSWVNLLVDVLSQINKRSVQNLIAVGAFSKFKKRT